MASEFSSLLELALTKGFKHSFILEQIHLRILNQFKQKYPKAPISTMPVIEEDSGQVHLVSEGKDIMPKEFKAEAESLARQVIIESISSPTQQHSFEPTGASSAAKPITFSFSALLFWVYNGLFAIYNFFLGILFLFSGFFGLPTLLNIKSGSFSLLAALILLALPYISIYVARKKKLSQTPGLLGRILFWGELPLVLLCIPVLIIPSLPSGIGYLWLLGLTLPLVLVTAENNSGLSRFGLAVRTIGLAVGTYFSLLLLFFVPLIFSSIFSAIISTITSTFRPNYYSSGISPNLFGTALSLLFSFFGLIGGLVVVLLPLLLPIILGVLVYRSWKYVEKQYNTKTASLTVGVPLVLLVVLFFSTIIQLPGNSLLTTLATFHELDSFNEKMEKANILSGKEKEVQTVVNNWRSQSQYYLFRDGDHWLSDAYTKQLGFTNFVAILVEKTFYVVASPIVYKNTDINLQKIYENYQLVYGTPFGTTRNNNVNTTKNVSIVTRQIQSLTDVNNIFATVTYEEEYRNETFQEQEVIYEFSLPPDAVVTDLDLGPEYEFQGQIAPRGAARRTYTQQIVQRKDPALLEQVGPRQYRLRVYPIPSKNDQTTLRGRNQKVRFTYVTPISWEGIPLPRFSKKQNMTETNLKQTAYLNGKEISVNQDTSIIEDESARLRYCNSQLSFGTLEIEKQQFSLTADDRQSVCEGKGRIITHSSDKKIALVIDNSAGNSLSLNSSLEALFHDNETFLKSGLVDLYYANSTGVSDAISLQQNAPAIPKAYFGSPPTLQNLQLIQPTYDAVVVLTGGTQPVLSTSTDERGIILQQPLFIYHLYGQIPTYPDDVTTSIVSSGGMVVDSIADAYFRIPTRRNGAELGKNGWYSIAGTNLLQNTQLSVQNPVPTGGLSLPEKRNTVSSYEGIVAKQSIYSSIYHYPGGDIWSDIPLLDRLNSVAQHFGIVTPFSSSLALVNTAQQMQLQQQNNQTGRYEADTPSRVITQLSGEINSPSIPFIGMDSMFRTQQFSGGTINLGNPTAVRQFGSAGPAMLSTSFGSASPTSGLLIANVVRIFIIINVGILLIGVLFYLPKFIANLRKRSIKK